MLNLKNISSLEKLQKSLSNNWNKGNPTKRVINIMQVTVDNIIRKNVLQ